jgi:hypothetical protein
MSVRVDTSSLIAGACVVGNRGLGVLGSAVPSTGEHGAGYLYNDLVLPADADKEVRGLITVAPVGLDSFFAFEDSSFEAAGNDGIYGFTYRLFVDGVDQGTADVTINIGGTTTTPAAGVATVSAIGGSRAATAASSAAGAASVSVVGLALASGAPVPAAGVATVSAVGSSQADGATRTPTPADGVAVVSAVGASLAAAAFVPASGVAVVSVSSPSTAGDETYPLAGLSQDYPLTTAQTYPLAGQVTT